MRNGIEINGRIYEAFEENDRFRFSITSIAEQRRPPASLCKYYSLSEQSVGALVSQSIYATHPDQFNDLFDCYSALIDWDDPEIASKWLAEEDSARRNAFMIQLQKGDQKLKNIAAHSFRQMMYRFWGVLCLTEAYDRTLLWGYYSNFKGFVVEFDYSQFDFKYHGPFDIHYVDTLEPIKFSFLKERIDLKFLPSIAAIYQVSIKQTEWQHEKEWRLIVETQDVMEYPGDDDDEMKQLGGRSRIFQYPINAIKRIILGPRFFLSTELEIAPDRSRINIALKKDIEEKTKMLEFIAAQNIAVKYSHRSFNVPNILEYEVKVGYEEGVFFLIEQH